MKKKLFIFIIIIILIIIPIFMFCYNNYLIIVKANTDNILIKNNTIILESLTLRQKIAQMIIVRGDNIENIGLMRYNVGGIFLDKAESQEEYSSLIDSYQNNSKIKLFVSTDLEGAWNPFKKFKYFPKFSEINSSNESHNIGLEHGKILKNIGFNLNFAPVSEYIDQSYGGRTFLGNKSIVKDKLKNYILGLQENVFGTCKHYPGKGLINNLHVMTDKENISSDDLELFNECIKDNITAIMVGHQIVEGFIDSSNKPSSVSKEVLGNLKDFKGLMISDEINMQGLKSIYSNKSEMYGDLINSGENVILDFDLNTRDLSRLLDELETLNKNGSLNIDNIDESVDKILIAKGYKVVG
jgi:beta-glucosidase-like glycosyl hydrolase